MLRSITQLIQLMRSHGAKRFYAKKLSPNDNSKNQVYLGGDFSALNIIPHLKLYTDSDEVAGSIRDRIKADVRFFWVDVDGKYSAPESQLILYPKYPEVRMSGFLKGCRRAPSEVMRVRDEGRVLFLGVTDDGDILGYATMADDPLSKEIYQKDSLETVGVFLEIPPDLNTRGDTKHQLLSALRRIYEKHWIPSSKMRSDGTLEPYHASNGGGYTLEAELGISPNCYAEPDYLGWEIKQYSVSNFVKYKAKTPATLFTPEPTSGIYCEEGVESFLHKFGYPDTKGIQDRFNFGGVHKCGKDFHSKTGLKMVLLGFDETSNKITDVHGGIALVSKNNEIAAMWDFIGMMNHWKRKHTQAAYVPSICQKPPPKYAFGPRILLCEETDFTLFLNAVAAGDIYYDPGIKCENASSSKPKIKRRSQFRISHKNLKNIYKKHESIELV